VLERQQSTASRGSAFLPLLSRNLNNKARRHFLTLPPVTQASLENWPQNCLVLTLKLLLTGSSARRKSRSEMINLVGVSLRHPSPDQHSSRSLIRVPLDYRLHQLSTNCGVPYFRAVTVLLPPTLGRCPVGAERSVLHPCRSAPLSSSTPESLDLVLSSLAGVAFRTRDLAGFIRSSQIFPNLYFVPCIRG
jgi:hypothetical protein